MPSVISPKLLWGEYFLTWIQAIILHWMRSRDISVSVTDPPWGPSAASNQDVQLLGDGSWGLKWFWQTESRVLPLPGSLWGLLPMGWKVASPPSSTSQMQDSRKWGITGFSSDFEPSLAIFSIQWDSVVSQASQSRECNHIPQSSWLWTAVLLSFPFFMAKSPNN